MKQQLLEIIQNEINEYCGFTVNPDLNLFCEDVGLSASDVLIIIMRIEEKMCMEITDIFRTNDCNIMTIANIAESISNCLQ